MCSFLRTEAQTREKEPLYLPLRDCPALRRGGHVALRWFEEWEFLRNPTMGGRGHLHVSGLAP